MQDRDKEMALVQRTYLNTTGPLCSLHDSIASGTQVSMEDIKSIVEQTLCFLGSANNHFSVLRRKKDLANINPSRPNSDLSQTSHCNIKDLSVSEVMRIENMITQVKFY